VRGVSGPTVTSAQALLVQDNITMKEAEKQLIIRALNEAGGNRTLAAKKIGLSRRTLHRKLHTYHLEGF
jgi:DNA-binding NtrC family response regulator